jgi:hypothetical protein
VLSIWPCLISFPTPIIWSVALCYNAGEKMYLQDLQN